MADASDFPPEADPPLAEKSSTGLRQAMDLETAIVSVQRSPAAYVLESADGTYLYRGACRDLVDRLKDHRAGRVAHTKNRRPLRLVHVDYVADYTAARQRENWLKSGVGRVWLKQQLNARVVEWQTQRT